MSPVRSAESVILTRFVSGTILLLAFIVALSACSNAGESAPTLTPTVSSTATTVAPTETPTLTPTQTAAPTDTPTRTPTLTPSNTPIPTATATPGPTPGPTPDGVVREAHVPILMYHYISTAPEDAHPYRKGNSIAPSLFAEHLDYLIENDYTTIPLKDLISYLATGQPLLPEKPIILTFDDGYEDVYTNALPTLAERNMTGTFFIITDYATESIEGHANWDQLAEMADAGMEIGSHSRNHPNLANQDLDYLVWQALGSQETIEANTGVHPHILSYPAGSYDQLVIDVFQSAHYWGAVTTQLGADHSSDHLFEFKRVRVSNGTDAAKLEALLNYDWSQLE